MWWASVAVFGIDALSDSRDRSWQMFRMIRVRNVFTKDARGRCMSSHG